ncbi:MAG: hypothetical protein KF787_06675 [Phycisphaeraceae bacterium]|nr:hypothetical protein [Phycisphaerae bacterium]MBX3392317.1 hypothetical protein [Phycisphaeraceae bacterium]
MTATGPAATHSPEPPPPTRHGPLEPIRSIPGLSIPTSPEPRPPAVPGRGDQPVEAAVRPSPPPDALSWSEVVARCPSRSLQAVLQGLRAVEYSPERVVLDGPAGLVRTAELRLEEMTRAIRDATGRKTAVTLTATEPPTVAEPLSTSPSTASPGRSAPRTLPTSSMSDHPLVRQATELLNARLIRVEPRETRDG